MKWGPLLFVFFVTVFFTICIPAGVAALWCWRNRGINGNSRILIRLAVLMMAISYERMSALVATGFGFDGPKPIYSLGYAVAYWQGQAVMAIAVLWFLSFLLSSNKKESHMHKRPYGSADSDNPPPPPPSDDDPPPQGPPDTDK